MSKVLSSRGRSRMIKVGESHRERYPAHRSRRISGPASDKVCETRWMESEADLWGQLWVFLGAVSDTQCLSVGGGIGVPCSRLRSDDVGCWRRRIRSERRRHFSERRRWSRGRAGVGARVAEGAGLEPAYELSCGELYLN